MWLARQDEPRQHLPAIFETDLVRSNVETCQKLCRDRTMWLRQKRSIDLGAAADGDLGMDGLLGLAHELVKLDDRSSIGWMASSFVLMADQ